MQFPSTHDAVIGMVCVVLGCAALFASLDAARRTRNWLLLICALGSFVFVLGVAGQRVSPTDDQRRLDPINATHHTPGPWEAGVEIPVIGVNATPVAVGGFLVAVIGLSLVLFFEAVPEGDHPALRPLPPFDDGETV